MTEIQKYKYATLFFVIVAAILAISLVVKSTTPPPATNSVTDATQSIKDCNQNIAAWRMQYAATTSPSVASPDAQAQLSAILSTCDANVH